MVKDDKMQTEQILKISELSALLRISERTLYRKVEKKEIPYMRVGKTGAFRFLKSDFIPEKQFVNSDKITLTNSDKYVNKQNRKLGNA